jgi:hypothetical protein
MSQISNNSAVTNVQSTGGNFAVTYADGSKKELCFASLMIEIGIMGLTANQQAFETQMKQAEALVQAMEKLNAIVQKAGILKAGFAADAKSDAVLSAADGALGVDELYNMLYNEFNLNYPAFATKADFGYKNGPTITRGSLETLISNLQTSQSLLASFNEQQGTRTSQAMSRSSGFLQQLQTAMQTAKEAMAAAAKSGGL